MRVWPSAAVFASSQSLHPFSPLLLRVYFVCPKTSSTSVDSVAGQQEKVLSMESSIINDVTQVDRGELVLFKRNKVITTSSGHCYGFISTRLSGTTRLKLTHSLSFQSI